MNNIDVYFVIKRTRNQDYIYSENMNRLETIDSRTCSMYKREEERNRAVVTDKKIVIIVPRSKQMGKRPGERKKSMETKAYHRTEDEWNAKDGQDLKSNQDCCPFCSFSFSALVSNSSSYAAIEAELRTRFS